MDKSSSVNEYCPSFLWQLKLHRQHWLQIFFAYAESLKYEFMSPQILSDHKGSNKLWRWVKKWLQGRYTMSAIYCLGSSPDFFLGLPSNQ